MRVYLDNCCYNRPFDEQDQLSVRLETEAKLYIQRLMRLGVIEYVWSDELVGEAQKCPFSNRQEKILTWGENAAWGNARGKPHYTGGFFRAHGGFWAMNDKPIDWSAPKYRDPLEEIYAVRQMISAEYGHDIRKLAAAMARKTARAEALGMNYGEYCLWLLERQAASPLCVCESGPDET